MKRPGLSPKRDAALAALFWTAAVALSVAWNVGYTQEVVEGMARAEADGAFNKDLTIRRWAAQHGGVYVPITEDTPPNPKLSHLPERDISSDSGVEMTLVNPAYLTRQLHDLGARQYGLRGHLTSLKPLRPENAPDDWERAALTAIGAGTGSVSEVCLMDGAEYMRVMHPLHTEASCLKCHAAQGYKVGDVRGGISVSVPMAPYRDVARAGMLGLLGGHALIWLLGLSGIVVGGISISRRLRERARAEQEVLRYRDHLEELVEQRSTELRAVNAQLQERVTECQQIEESLRAERDNLSAILESMEDAAYVADEDYNLLYVNRAMVRAFGAPGGKKCYEYMRGRDGVCPSCIRDTTNSGEAQRWEWHSSQTDRTYDVIDTTLRAPDGGMRKLEVFRDISDRKRSEAKLEEHAKMLEAKNAELDEFAYMASHDLQEPLRKMISFGRLLRIDLGEDLPEKAATDLDFITDAAERMQRLVQSLLQLSRAGRSAMEAVPVSMGSCVDEALASLAARIEETDAEVERDTLPEVVGDATLLTQLYQNLIGNALKFVPEGTRPHVRLTAERREDAWQLTVGDNGIGIAPEHIEKVFGAFQRLHGRSAYGGTGIGLAICRKAVERHGGAIWIESEVGVGSRFCFTIPDRPVPADSEQAAGVVAETT